ncbi:hypothetical protein NBO_54g0012 [Nosema bombycis CQ1]|uniref:CCAAT-binding factor domain-containing protein n=1 Tax=Nosema bombycis (strain CQ1 / CVCC 102059) TaxID=578461 RepID=R0KSX7_NOSB1|nr:hypothetical protein NBO_54g0012 [Nosema bombycis CQ1]|eukprot:EOB13866.1 hypothetical protein NBO_54g0012 [Nosema bombycis CQ1]
MVQTPENVNDESDMINKECDSIYNEDDHEDNDNVHQDNDNLIDKDDSISIDNFLVNFTNFKSPEDILLNLSILSQSNLEFSLPLDDLIVYSFHILKHDHLKEFLDLLYDLFIGMRDPRNVVIPLFNYQKENPLSILVLKVIFFVIQNYDFQFNDFYNCVYESITLINLEQDTNEKLIFIINLLFNNNSVNVKYMKSIIKKLMSITLEGSTELSLKIVYSVLNILRCNPVLFEMALNEDRNEDGVYKELEILSFSIKEISILTNQIKKEAKSKEIRMKFINLSNLKFPEIKI